MGDLQRAPLTAGEMPPGDVWKQLIKHDCHTHSRGLEQDHKPLSGNQEWAYAGRGETSNDPLEPQGRSARQHHYGGHARHLFQSKIQKTRSALACDR